jgi:hypothetical protein
LYRSVSPTVTRKLSVFVRFRAPLHELYYNKALIDNGGVRRTILR